jgi:hypothetical protein
MAASRYLTFKFGIVSTALAPTAAVEVCDNLAPIGQWTLNPRISLDIYTLKSINFDESMLIPQNVNIA